MQIQNTPEAEEILLKDQLTNKTLMNKHLVAHVRIMCLVVYICLNVGSK